MSPNQLIILRFAREPGDPVAFPDDPLASALGARLVHLGSPSSGVSLSFEPARLFVQGEGVLQGGAVCAMLDFATACAVMAALPEGQGCATMSLTTSFMRPVPLGRYLVSAQIEKQGRSAVFARATLAPDGRTDVLLASATAVLTVSTGLQREPTTGGRRLR